ncbi:MAG: sugar phosphate isomerase/epimerase [Clostridia bacterium]|nr:sugar phosphate isomerase/epimerase [Clostridia bacterium]
MKLGLVSVTFRKLNVKEIIKLAKENSIEYIEWGSSPHVEMGNVRLARKVKRLMHANNIKCASYGSYYGVTYKKGQHRPLPFKKACKTAVALGAKTIRIWAGWPLTGGVTQNERDKAVLHTREIADVAKKYGLTVSFECHFDTITEDYKQSIQFIKDIDRDNVKIYWQANPFKSFEYNVEAIKALLPYTTHVHVCNWKELEKFPLADAFSDWCEYAKLLKNDDRVFMLEFMPDAEPASLPTETQTLRDIAKEVE